jgi:hypothetical protein
MAPDRPILDRWRTTPWVAKTPVDDRTIGGILTDEVQVAFRGDGPMHEREIVPLTGAARELLYGHDRDAARKVFRGVLATLDGMEGAATLRGMSLASDQAAFATNLLMSNTEAGFVDDAVAANDPAKLERNMLRLLPSVQAAKAQNTGWMDLGPRVSAQLLDVIRRGPAAGRDAATEVALTTLHELQHSISPHDPRTIEDRHVWLEEGIAETLAWWPGQAAALRERIGVPIARGEVIDPWSVPPDSVASAEYRNRHRAVQQLLGLAGVDALHDDGTPDPHGHARAMQLLQGDAVDRVPRNLARAIIRTHHLDEATLPDLAERIAAIDGSPERVDALAGSLGISS